CARPTPFARGRRAEYRRRRGARRRGRPRTGASRPRRRPRFPLALPQTAAPRGRQPPRRQTRGEASLGAPGRTRRLRTAPSSLFAQPSVFGNRPDLSVRYRRPAVGAVGMGCMYLSIQDRPTEEAAVRTLLAAMDAGISLLDTADVYCHDQRDIGHNERLVARAPRERESAAVTVATKGGLERPNGAWTRNGRPGHLRRACEASLAALGVDRIDVYQLHAPDPSVPFADSVGELARLRAEGKIAHVGLSNVTVSEIEEVRRIVPVVSVQNRWNPGDRAPETDGVLATCS